VRRFLRNVWDYISWGPHIDCKWRMEAERLKWERPPFGCVDMSPLGWEYRKKNGPWVGG
jgi:hypothetical protein